MKKLNFCPLCGIQFANKQHFVEHLRNSTRHQEHVQRIGEDLYTSYGMKLKKEFVEHMEKSFPTTTKEPWLIFSDYVATAENPVNGYLTIWGNSPDGLNHRWFDGFVRTLIEEGIVESDNSGHTIRLPRAGGSPMKKTKRGEDERFQAYVTKARKELRVQQERKKLAEAGAKVNITAGGATPLHIAVDNGSPEIINSLLKAGADPNVTDEDGLKPVQVAAAGGNRKAVEILFPLTSEIQNVSERTVDGVLENMQSETGREQRAATKDAGHIVGSYVLRIINEPTAASLAYGFEKKNSETILVFDLRGGIFDVSVIKVGDRVFEVLSTSGDTHVGGDDFDKRIIDWLAGNFKRDEGIDLLKDKQALQHLTEAAEKAQMELSSLTQTNRSLPFVTATADGPKHIDATLTRAKFEELCSDLLDRLRRPAENALRDAKLSLEDIEEVILVGGSTHIPAVQELVRKQTAKEPNVTINPDEVVALEAAVQAGVLAGDVSDVVLLDVTPLSLGLETFVGVMTKIIPKNTTLPTSKSEVFSTAAGGQTSVEINVLQGERKFAKDNKSLGRFHLDGIPPAPRGFPQIEVQFDIDANGILSVTAVDKGTGKKQDITITGVNTLPKDEV